MSYLKEDLEHSIRIVKSTFHKVSQWYVMLVFKFSGLLYSVPLWVCPAPDWLSQVWAHCRPQSGPSGGRVQAGQGAAGALTFTTTGGGGGCDLVIFCGKRIVIARNDARLWSGTRDFFIFSCIPFYADWLLQFVSDSAVFQSSGDIWQYFLSSVSSAYVWISSSELSNILWRLPVPVLYLGEIYLSTSRHTPASSSAYPLLFVFKC